MKGFTERRNSNGIYAVECHYTADPAKDPCSTPASEEVYNAYLNVPVLERADWAQEQLKNPDLPPQMRWFLQMKRIMITEKNWDQEMEINPTIYTGKPVFPTFNNEAHIQDRIQPVVNFPIITSYDFGYHFPVMLASQFDGTQLRILYEWMPFDIDNWAFGHAVHQRLDTIRTWNLKIRNYTGREANRTHEDTGDTTRKIFGALGIELAINPNPDIFNGIAKIRNLLHFRSGVPGIIIDRSCTELIKAFRGGYRYPDNRGKSGIEKAQKETPFKDGYFDNIMDALRYGVDANFSLSGEYNYTEEEEALIAQNMQFINPHQSNRVIDLHGLDMRAGQPQSSFTGY